MLIVGAGPTGLSLAIRLRQLGVDCLVIDRAEQPSLWSRALGIHARTLEIFHALGVLDALVKDAVMQTEVRVYNDRGPLFSLDLTSLDAPFPWVLSCPQNRVEAILEERFTSLGGILIRGAELIDFDQEGESVKARIRLSDGDQLLSCSLMVGCDGAHSCVREQLGLRFDGVTQEDHFLLTDVDISWSLPGNSSHGFLLSSGSLIALPLPEDWRLIMNLPGETTAEEPLSMAPFKARLEEAIGESVDMGEPRWLTRFSIHRRLASHYRRNRVLLAGDAAHIQSPLGAQGMNTGIADSFNLAWKLALFLEGYGGGRLLDSYEAERRPVARTMLHSVDVLSRTSFAQSRVLRYGRDMVLGFLARQPKLSALLLRRASQLDVNYRGSAVVARASSLSLGEWAGPQPGDRFPDAIMDEPVTGAKVRLLDLLRDPRHYLFIQLPEEPDARQIVSAFALADRVPSEFGRWVRTVIVTRLPMADSVREIAEFDVSVLADSNGEFARRCHSDSGMWLVRPDGHLGFAADREHGDQVLQYLRHLTGR